MDQINLSETVKEQDIIIFDIIDKEDEKIMAINLKLIRVRLNFMVDENFLLPFWRPKELLRVFFALFRYNYKKLIFSFSNKLNQRR